MARKRREGITTPVRYMGKMYAVGYGIFHGNEELAKLYATLLMVARDKGFGTYTTIWKNVEGKLREKGVPSVFWGICKAFTNELIRKVIMKQEATPEEVKAKWVRWFTKVGLDTSILDDIVNIVVQREVPEETVSAPKGA